MCALPAPTPGRAECIGRTGVHAGRLRVRHSVAADRGCTTGGQRPRIASLCNGVQVAGTVARIRSRRRMAALVAAVFLVGAVVGVLLASGGDEPAPLKPGRGPAADPLAWRPGEDSRFEDRAAAGESHVLYAKSPGGAVATAQRVAHWRPLIEAAARRHGVAPDDLEALAFLESAGRPEVCAGAVDGACGL